MRDESAFSNRHIKSRELEKQPAQSRSGLTQEILAPQQVSPHELLEIRALRARAWLAAGIANAGDFSDGLWEVDPVDAVAYHVLLRDSGRLAAAARLSIHQSVEELPDFSTLCKAVAATDLGGVGPYASLNRLVVDPDLKGNGLASMLLEPRILLALLAGAKTLVCNVASAHPDEGRTRTLAERYKRIGFRKQGHLIESGPGDWTEVLCGCPTHIWKELNSSAWARIIENYLSPNSPFARFELTDSCISLILETLIQSAQRYFELRNHASESDLELFALAKLSIDKVLGSRDVSAHFIASSRTFDSLYSEISRRS